jgi:hypothetical protein
MPDAVVVVLIVLAAAALLYLLISFGVLGSAGKAARSGDETGERRDTDQ